MSTLIFITPSESEGPASPAYLIMHGSVDFLGSSLDLRNNPEFFLPGTYALFDVADCTSVTNEASLVVTPHPPRTAGVPFRVGNLICVTLT
jgi:hypothetical protein